MTAQAGLQALDRHAACSAARMANCGECWARPDRPCMSGESGEDGFHLARLVRAYRRGLVSAPALAAVLNDLVVFTTATVVYDTPEAAR